MKSAVTTRNPVVETQKPGGHLAVVLPKTPRVTTSDSSWNLSDPGVLSITILMAAGFGFLAWVGWRRLRFQGWGWRYNARQFWEDSRGLEDMQTALKPRLASRKKPDGSRGTPPADDPMGVAGADTPTRT